MARSGNVSTDTTKVRGNASRYKAMIYSYIQKDENVSKKKSGNCSNKPKKTDETEDAVRGSRRGNELPEELAR
ncbi:MAG: hypothetical protein ACFCD0_13600 [Gemmataceae bacterium]